MFFSESLCDVPPAPACESPLLRPRSSMQFPAGNTPPGTAIRHLLSISQTVA
jgi:hypothetical protein